MDRKCDGNVSGLMYRAIETFVDLQDDRYKYHAGEIYPRDGIEVTEARVKELSGRGNASGHPLIMEVDEPKKPKRRKRTK